MRCVETCLASLLLGFLPFLASGEDKNPGPALVSKEEARKGAIVYKAPPTGAPRGRVGGGSRGDSRELSIAVVAPDQTGWTSRADPDLYWYISQAVGTPPEFTLVQDGKDEPIIELTLTSPVEPGMQKISLASMNKTLAPNTEYQWFISFVPDRHSRSKDVVAGGRIAFVPATSAMAPAGSADARAIAYAGSGYWYDAISALQAASQQSLTADLCEQVGLNQVALFLRGRH